MKITASRKNYKNYSFHFTQNIALMSTKTYILFLNVYIRNKLKTN